MNNSDLICYSLGERRTLDRLKKELGKDYMTVIDKGYFVLLTHDDNNEPVYVFTQKGKDAAWGK